MLVPSLFMHPYPTIMKNIFLGKHSSGYEILKRIETKSHPSSDSLFESRNQWTYNIIAFYSPEIVMPILWLLLNIWLGSSINA